MGAVYLLLIAMQNYLRFLLAAVLMLTLSAPVFASAAGFSSWLNGVKVDARDRGISSDTINEAFSDAEYLPRVIELDRKQPESRLTYQEYKTKVITQQRIDQGRRLIREHRSELNAASQKYGVPPEVIVALWGMETSYGKNTGGFSVISALATLAYEGRREKFFRAELMNALEIIDEGHISAGNMTGSWAGAMGQNQFMPSSFKSFAVDGNGDGRRDIWRSLPDVFASTANYLSKSGWNDGEKWGRQVKVTQDIPESLTGVSVQKSIVEWSNMGVRTADGGKLPTNDGMYASLVMPDGANGKAYLIYNNYRVIMKWNKSVYFATSVGLLSDLIRE